LAISFDDAQTEFTIYRKEKQPRLVAVFNSTTPRKVAETTAGVARIASGEMRNFMLSITCMFIFLMQEFHNRPTRFVKRWNQPEMLTAVTSEGEMAPLDSMSPRTPGARSVSSKIDADSGSPSPVKLGKHNNEGNNDEDDEKQDTSATDTGEDGATDDKSKSENSDNEKVKSKSKAKKTKDDQEKKKRKDSDSSNNDNDSNEETSTKNSDDSEVKEKEKNKGNEKAKGNAKGHANASSVHVKAVDTGYLIKVGDDLAKKTVTVTIKIDESVVGPFTLDTKA